MEYYVYSVFIVIIKNLIIDKSRLYYKITIKYWQNVPYSQLYYEGWNFNSGNYLFTTDTK